MSCVGIVVFGVDVVGASDNGTDDGTDVGADVCAIVGVSDDMVVVFVVVVFVVVVGFKDTEGDKVGVKVNEGEIVVGSVVETVGKIAGDGVRNVDGLNVGANETGFEVGFNEGKIDGSALL